MANNLLFQKVRDLRLPAGQYALFGSAPLGVRGLKECRDVDIIVIENLWREYENKNWKKEITPHGYEYLFYQEVELWKDWWPGNWNIKQLISEAEMIDGLPFVRLEEVIKWKKMIGREKDFKDIEVAEKFLAQQKTQ